MNNGWDPCADVVVVGAGASGLPAAIGAARAGASVILVEEDSIIGGAPCDMYVAMLCGGPITGILREAHTGLRTAHSIIPGVTAGECFLL
jgi:ribulose 1,5-bisphosphate synthetase/thiazole synthase